MNKVILTGRLTKDVEMRTTQSGKSVASFTIAADRLNAKKLKEQNQQSADFIPCVAWEHNAEFIDKWFGKGSPILVEGRMQVRSYQAQDGGKRYVTEVVVQHAEFNGPKQSNKQGQQPYNGNYPEDEEIPF